MAKIWISMWTAQLAKVGALLAARATQAPFGDAWSQWDLDADQRRAVRDLDAIRVHFPDHA
ncbi:hypothetical protein BH10ACT9_BH10ACT9_49240 [soil metagenome]